MHRVIAALLVTIGVAFGTEPPLALASNTQMGPPTAAPPRVPPRIPIGYDPEPDGTALRVRIGSVRIDGPGFTAEVTNADAREIVGITYMATVERLGAGAPVQTLEQNFGPMNLSMGRTIILSAKWLNSEELDNLQSGSAARLQMFLAPSRIRFADGGEWTLAIDSTASDMYNAMNRRAPRLPRTLVGAPAPATAARDQLCRDELNRGYSPGATAEIRDEPGRLARCVNSQWVEIDR